MDESFTPTEIDLIKRLGRAFLIAAAFVLLALKQSYFDYPALGIGFAIFFMSLIDSTVKYTKLAIVFLLMLAIIPPQTADLLKGTATSLISLFHG
jgi:hypothetical protein